ncbi:MAG TPA: class I SAM-dependent methyltransferase [Thermoleophilaceae bacterium]|nr:class I SAM-dependent methyltransferase [Thermoleophilaceae bacterium]
MAAPATAEEIHEVNVRYHDLAAEHYDAKWGIDYGELGQSQVTGKLAKALGGSLGDYRRGLEIGAGTGYFGLNLALAGVVRDYTASDISPGMLEVLASTAATLGVDAATVCAEAAELPFEDESFDIVFGHAILHHLPDLDGAFGELMRVLRPGGAIAFCGEPSYYGDRLAELPKRAAWRLSPAWRTVLRARAAERDRSDVVEEDTLERVVDVHAFTPGTLARHARRAGFDAVKVRGEELAASLFGWANRSFEASARPEDVPLLWRKYAYHGYLALQKVDRAVLEPRLPPAVFYNLLLSARKAR